MFDYCNIFDDRTRIACTTSRKLLYPLIRDCNKNKVMGNCSQRVFRRRTTEKGGLVVLAFFISRKFTVNIVFILIGLLF